MKLETIKLKAKRPILRVHQVKSTGAGSHGDKRHEASKRACRKYDPHKLDRAYS